MSGVITNPAALNVMRDARRFVGREPEFAALDRHLAGVLQGDLGRAATLFGPVGSGKTQLAKAYAKDLARRLAEAGVLARIVHVNCRMASNATLLLGAIQAALTYDSSMQETASEARQSIRRTRGWSSHELALGIKRYLRAKGAHAIIIVDEPSIIAQRDAPGIGYLLSRLNEGNTGPVGGATILFCNETDIRDRLDAATRSVMGSCSISLHAPDAKDIAKILANVATEALKPESWDTDALAWLAGEAQKRDDIRFAINTLAAAAQNGHVSLANVKATDIEDLAEPHLLDGLTETQRSILAAVEVASRKAPTTTGDVEKAYNKACRASSTKAVKHTQLWKTLKDLQQRSLIESRMSGKGHAGTTQILNVPPNVRTLLADH
jgi:Cdc6-like AAA superfamily ATPase